MTSYVDDLKQLINPRRRGKGRLRPAQSREAIASSIGIAEQPEEGGGGGDYTEVDDTREYHDVGYLTSSDGLTIIERENPKKFTMLGEDGKNHFWVFQDNPADPPA